MRYCGHHPEFHLFRDDARALRLRADPPFVGRARDNDRPRRAGGVHERQADPYEDPDGRRDRSRFILDSEHFFVGDRIKDISARERRRRVAEYRMPAGKHPGRADSGAVNQKLKIKV